MPPDSTMKAPFISYTTLGLSGAGPLSLDMQADARPGVRWRPLVKRQLWIFHMLQMRGWTRVMVRYHFQNERET
jgi:hypothetical protein